MKIETYVEIDVENLALQLCPEEACKVIETIYREQQCADFTFDMAMFFIKEVEKYEEN